MAIMKKPSNELPKELVSQAMETLSSENQETERARIPAAAVKARQVTAAPAESFQDSKNEKKNPSGKYSDVINLKLPKGERNRLKGLCAQFGISMNQFILYSIYELEERIMDGKCTVSQMGVREISR